MISFSAVFAILWSHFFADFILQRRVDAEGKSSSFYSLFVHIWCYVTALIAIMFGFNFIFNLTDSPLIIINWAVFNAIAHMVVDFFTSRASKKYFTKGDTHTAFSIIGFDQWLHSIMLLGTWMWIF